LWNRRSRGDHVDSDVNHSCWRHCEQSGTESQP
jgi:hypothetical protein